MITLSASRMAAAIGLDHTRSRYSLYREMAHGEKPEVSEFQEQLHEFGHDHEAAAVAWVEQASLECFFWTGDQQRERKRGCYTCRSDGLNAEYVLEVKSRAPGLLAYEPGDDNWRKHMPQVQQQMWVCDREKSLFACWCVGGGSRLWEIARSEQYINRMHLHAREFLGFLDGKQECPKRIKSRPRMPAVNWKLLAGPECKARAPLEGPLLTALAAKEGQGCRTVEELQSLEIRLYEEHGDSAAILEGTRGHRMRIEDTLTKT